MTHQYYCNLVKLPNQLPNQYHLQQQVVRPPPVVSTALFNTLPMMKMFSVFIKPYLPHNRHFEINTHLTSIWIVKTWKGLMLCFLHLWSTAVLVTWSTPATSNNIHITCGEGHSWKQLHRIKISFFKVNACCHWETTVLLFLCWKLQDQWKYLHKISLKFNYK